uniref:Activin_recp domain-containing protein n=1 Tax=Panagrellus redivivus TaxID=6233 RepID=A0A7E4V1F6_PANRE
MSSRLRLSNILTQNYLIVIIFTICILNLCITATQAVNCFECFDTGPTNKNCTREKTCSGAACLIFEDGNNITTTAFCLLTSEHVAMNRVSAGCWVEADGKSKHCVCFTDYCNELRDRTVPSEGQDPMASPIKSLTILKHNPFLDYDYTELDDSPDAAENKMHARPAPANLLFPSALEEDLKTAGDDSDDLVPVDFAEYTNGEQEPPAPADDILGDPSLATLTMPSVLTVLACLITAALRP